MDLFRLTAHEAGELLRRRETSSLELTRTALDRISNVDSQVCAFVTVCEDQALHQARLADERLKNGKATLLTGVPALIKDNMCTNGVRTTCSSKMLENFVPPWVPLPSTRPFSPRATHGTLAAFPAAAAAARRSV
jgi:aspartyl-tRNA(Asn)/glutamyl-tRNA(Gln) amidotransferase subunit A